MSAITLFMLSDDGFKYDLVRGELRRISPAVSEHGAIIARLTGALMQHVEAHDLGEVFGAETGFKLESNPDTVLGPDLSFVREARIPPTGLPKAFWPGAPDLAVEVVSPGNTRAEMNEKIKEYLAAGTRLIWIIQPKQRTITLYRANTEPLKMTCLTDKM